MGGTCGVHGERENGHGVLLLKSEGMNRYVDEEIILKCILKTLDTRAWIGSSQL
jgi:hypothetical protein